MAKIPYQEAVGSLLFLSQVTRPDISFAVNYVSRFNHDPGKSHWAAVKRILRYIKGTSHYKLQFDGIEKGDITGFCDADWASDQDERRSVTGYVFIKNKAALSWSTKKQPTIALSTTEAEYMTLSSAVQEALWLRGLSSQIFPDNTGPLLMHVDNQGAQHLALNGAYQARTKHIDVRHHFVRERIKRNEIKLRHVSTKQMAADCFTKPMDREKLRSCIRLLGLVPDREDVKS